MKLDNRRSSTNIDDRRGGRGGLSLGKGGLSIGALLIVGLIAWITGGNPLTAVMNEVGTQMTQSPTTQTYQPTTPEEQAVADFAAKILAGTEDVWTEQFASIGRTYEPPRMVYFTGSTTSGCGHATKATGPFYCSADRTIYIDLSFFNELRDRFGAGGDFAYAYVIAHEVGHHVEQQLGILDQAHTAMANATSERERNRISVRLELLADYYAGLWAHHDHRKFGSMEIGDLEEGLNAATAIGDDHLQRQAGQQVTPDAFNHGTSAQRKRWLRKGYEQGTISGGNTFDLPYEQL